MAYTTIERCRICGSSQLNFVLDLGEQALTGVFPQSPTEQVPSGPLTLVKCDEESGGCGLVQLRQSYDGSLMYGENYGYRSGLNKSMIRHLQHRVQCAMEMASPEPGDFIIDIGSNDSTTLRFYPTDLELLGVDPTGEKFKEYYPTRVQLLPDFFKADLVAEKYPNRKAKIITSLAMVYDLDAPQEFVRDIHRLLDNEGIWVFEQSYLPLMLKQNAYDTICHEHIEYYALRQIKWMLDRNGFKIIDIELNDVNGGSFCVTAAKDESSYRENTEVIHELLEAEDAAGLSTMEPFKRFHADMLQHRSDLQEFIQRAQDEGKTVCGYGASTKGNVMLQFCGFTPDHIPAIAEVNPDKFGCFTPQTNIPILSEPDVRAMNPDYLLVLPWHFRKGIVERESAWLESGGELVFPLPGLEVVRKPAKRVAA